jgi:hypothetical protein
MESKNYKLFGREYRRMIDGKQSPHLPRLWRPIEAQLMENAPPFNLFYCLKAYA